MPGGDDWGTAGDIILECELGQGQYIGTFWRHRRPDSVILLVIECKRSVFLFITLKNTKTKGVGRCSVS